MVDSNPRRFQTRLSVLFGLFFFVAIPTGHGQANPLVEDYEKLRQQVVDSDVRFRDIQIQVAQSNERLRLLATERTKANQEALVLEVTTRDLADKVKELRAQLQQTKSLLRLRLAAIYKFGGQGWARLMFSSQNAGDLDRNLKILGKISKRDLEMMREYSKLEVEIDKKNQRFLQRLAALKKAREHLLVQEQKIQEESSRKAKHLHKIRLAKSGTLKQMRQLRERTHLIVSDEFMDTLLRPSFFESKGALPAPVQGSIERKFGVWKDPDFDVRLSSKGIIYQAPQSRVSAVFPGRLGFLGQIEGLGLTAILDHGDHYYTVYGGLQKVDIAEGSELGQGQAFATSADRLYFEVRHFTEPHDPLTWMKGKSL